MIHGSLFSGIGGFDLGFERAGIETIWQVEIDDYCRRVLERHFPSATRYTDIRECGKHNLAPVDIISGGFPCQDISNAGKRVGIDGERSGLWSEYARIIRELRPRYVVVENVAALLNRGMERVLGDLAACGYDAEWQSIRASDVGAPHRRDRIWIVAHASSEGLAKREEPELLVQCPAIKRSDWWAVEPNVGRVANGISSRVDRLRGLGNAIVPQIAEWIGRRIVDYSY
jgi:DNA (cytosine-5)-methyltransferase 1